MLPMGAVSTTACSGRLPAVHTLNFLIYSVCCNPGVMICRSGLFNTQSLNVIVVRSNVKNYYFDNDSRKPLFTNCFAKCHNSSNCRSFWDFGHFYPCISIATWSGGFFITWGELGNCSSFNGFYHQETI